MRAQCGALKRNGERCTLPASGQQHGLCWAHDPQNADKRRRGASRGGRAKASKVTKALHELLSGLTEDVISGELDTGRGAVANQLISTRIRLLEFEQRAVQNELESMEPDLSALPEPETAPESDDWLFDSGRSYFEQLASYKAHQNGE